MEDKISRLTFLKSIGFKGSALMALYATGNIASSCSPTDSTVVPASVNISIDLTSSSYSALSTSGGYVVVSNVVIANIGGGNYAAASITCPHENRNDIFYYSGRFVCPVHGASFSTNGTCTNGITGRTLKIYNVSKSGNTLTIT